MMRSIAFTIFLALFLMQPPAARYAAPYGAGASCDVDQPCALSTALAQGGDVWLLPGTYKGDLSITTNGLSLRSVPGTRVVLDGDIQVWGEGVELRDLEITYTGWLTRTSAQAGSAPTDIPQKYLSIYGKGDKVTGCYIHDLAGVGFWQTATGAEMSDNLILNNGWKGPDRGHGPSIYAQNKSDGDKLIRNNIIGPSYSMTGFEFYGSPLASLKRFHIEGNVLNRQRFLLGGGTPIDDAHIKGNLLWKSSLEVGYTNPLNGDAEIVGNYVGFGAILPHKLQQLDMQGNTVINYGGLAVMDMTKPVSYTYVITGNAYLSNRTNVFWDAGILRDFPSWQGVGYDTAGSFGGLPTVAKVFVQPTRPHHGYVAVFNWGNAQSIPIDLTPLALTPGAGYKLVNALNPGEGLVFSTTTVSLPTGGWTVARPIAAAQPLVSYDPRFLVFLVEPAQ